MALGTTLPENEASKFRDTGAPSVGSTLDTLIAGEDLTNNVLKTEQRFSYSFTSLASITTVKSGAGFVHSVLVGAVSMPSLTIYDNTAASGTVLASFSPNTPIKDYLIDVSFTTGLTLAFTPGVAPQVTVSYR